MASSSTYKKYTQLEHVIARPGMYVGSVTDETDNLWVMNDKKEEMIEKKISHVPGLYKIFDEILVNAIDQSTIDNKLDTIKVWIDKNTITVENNGVGIPVEIHDDYKVYIPELIFGNMLTSSNYDDTKERTTGGMNGMGAKLTNIFSNEFSIEIDRKSVV